MRKKIEVGDYIDQMNIKITAAEEAKFNEILRKKELIDDGRKKFSTTVRKHRELVYEILNIDQDMELVGYLKKLADHYGTDPVELLQFFSQKQQVEFYRRKHKPTTDNVQQ